jgi:hypothetical protein
MMKCYQTLLSNSTCAATTWYNIEWKIAGGAVTGVLIPILNLLYQQAARALTNWAGWRGLKPLLKPVCPIPALATKMR